MRFDPIPGTAVLAFTGRARHGKDTAARFIVEALGVDAHRFALSDAISAYARVACGMTARDPVLLQAVGYQMRQERPDAWLTALYGAIADRAPRLALVTGVRFPDEVSLIRQMGGALVRVSRLTPAGDPFRATDRDNDHVTEQGIDGLAADRDVTNVTGALAAFRDEVLCVYHALALDLEAA